MTLTKFEMARVNRLGGVRSNVTPANRQNNEIQIKMADFLFGLERRCKRLFCASGHVVYASRFLPPFSQKSLCGGSFEIFKGALLSQFAPPMWNDFRIRKCVPVLMHVQSFMSHRAWKRWQNGNRLPEIFFLP